MATPFPAFRVTEVVPLPDRDYYHFLLHMIASAERRVWASIFLMDVRRANDVDLDVRRIVYALWEAAINGVDVRFINGRSTIAPDLDEMNRVSRFFLRTKGVRVRPHPAIERSSTHDKYVIVDDEWLILGSHNWTPNALANNREDSIAVRSPDLNRRQTQEFLKHWKWGVVEENHDDGE